MRGRFISIEGGDGAGKSTLAKALLQALSARGISSLLTREPGGTPLGEAIRSLLLADQASYKIGATAELLLFLSARAQNVEEVILPAINDGMLVISDRFNDSTIAYQGGGRGLGIDYVAGLCHAACHGLHPELTFLLDIESEEGLARRPPSRDRLEQETLTFHKHVRSAFLQLAAQAPQRYVVLDATRPPEELLSEVLVALERLFNT